MIPRNGYLNGVARDVSPPRPVRPPSPTSDHGLAPDGHPLELEPVEAWVSDDGTMMPAFDRFVGRCGCGHTIDEHSLGVVYGPPVAPTIVDAWLRHLAPVIGVDAIRDLRLALVDAESVARYGRPWRRTAAR